MGVDGNSRGWDVVCPEDAQRSPEARLLLRKLRYTIAIVDAVDAAHAALEDLLLTSKAVEHCTDNWCESSHLQGPPRAVVHLHWGREKEF